MLDSRCRSNITLTWSCQIEDNLRPPCPGAPGYETNNLTTFTLNGQEISFPRVAFPGLLRLVPGFVQPDEAAHGLQRNGAGGEGRRLFEVFQVVADGLGTWVVGA